MWMIQEKYRLSCIMPTTIQHSTEQSGTRSKQRKTAVTRDVAVMLLLMFRYHFHYI